MRRLINQLIALLVLGLLVLQVGCVDTANNYDLIGEFPVPENAQQVKKITLGSKNTQQLFFIITEKYPSVSVLEGYRDYLKKDGWIKCARAQEGWAFHEDLSGGRHHLVHQLTDYWISDNDKKLLILGAKYYSKERSKDYPDNDEQRIIVWVQRTSDLQPELERLELNCK